MTGGTLNLMSFIGVIMLMGLVAKNAILLLDCARKEEAQGVDREEALMHAGRVRLRPILMTTFALIAGMLPVAIGMGEGGEFYRPMAVAIIGGTITSTLLTLLVVPTFYDSIEIFKDKLVARYHRIMARFDKGAKAGAIGTHGRRVSFAASEFMAGRPHRAARQPGAGAGNRGIACLDGVTLACQHRLPVVDGDLAARLAHYRDDYAPALKSFGNLAIDTFALGVTGASYPLGRAGDVGMCESLELCVWQAGGDRQPRDCRCTGRPERANRWA